MQKQPNKQDFRISDLRYPSNVMSKTHISTKEWVRSSRFQTHHQRGGRGVIYWKKRNNTYAALTMLHTTDTTMQFQNSTIFLGEKFRCGIEFSAGQCVEWSRGRCKVIVIIWAIVKREGNCMAIYFHENCDRIIIPSVYFSLLKMHAKYAAFDEALQNYFSDRLYKHK